jgi:hypothetical protein
VVEAAAAVGERGPGELVVGAPPADPEAEREPPARELVERGGLLR